MSEVTSGFSFSEVEACRSGREASRSNSVTSLCHVSYVKGLNMGGLNRAFCGSQDGAEHLFPRFTLLCSLLPQRSELTWVMMNTVDLVACDF